MRLDQPPPFIHSMPWLFIMEVACPLRIPEAQHKITGLLSFLISSVFDARLGKGIFLAPLICPDRNSSLLRTSITTAPRLLKSWILSLFLLRNENSPILLFQIRMQSKAYLDYSRVTAITLLGWTVEIDIHRNRATFNLAGVFVKHFPMFDFISVEM